MTETQTKSRRLQRMTPRQLVLEFRESDNDDTRFPIRSELMRRVKTNVHCESIVNELITTVYETVRLRQDAARLKMILRKVDRDNNG